MNKKVVRFLVVAVLFAALIGGNLYMAKKDTHDMFLEKLLSQSKEINIGDSFSVNELARGAEEFGNIKWDISDEMAVSYTDGVLYAHSEGAVVITGVSNGETIIKCVLTVSALSVINLDSESSTIGVSLEKDIPFSFSGGYDTRVEFENDAPSVVSVDEKGHIKALSPGEAEIRIKAYGCESVVYSVNVLNSPDSIELSNEKIELGQGQSVTLITKVSENSYKEIPPVFSSSDISIASVNSDGTVTAVGTGTCKVSASTYTGAKAVCTVTVKKAPEAITISLPKKALSAGKTATVKVELDKDSAAGDILYSSDNEKVAIVSDKGVVTGKGEGTAEITATTYNGKSATCKVKVKLFDHTVPPTSASVEASVAGLCEMYPDLISSQIIGQSVKGKNINMMKIGKGEKKACIVAGIHSKEDISVAFTMRCMVEYAAAYASKSGKYGTYNLRNMLNEYTLYVVPTMNPDGLDICNNNEMPLYTQKLSKDDRDTYKSNANGVNLNRNFPFQWENSTDPKHNGGPDKNNYRGDSEASEPETQAIVKLVEENDFQWLFSVHCKGNMLYWCDADNKATKQDQLFATRLRDKCGYKLNGCSPHKNLGGGLENWFRYKTGKPGFCVELVDKKWSSDVNGYFDKKLNWQMTKYTFIQGMR